MKAPYEVLKTVRVTEKGHGADGEEQPYQVVVDKHANKLDIQICRRAGVQGESGRREHDARARQAAS